VPVVADLASLPLEALVETNREAIRATVARHRGRSVAVFGSVARGEETSTSDVDLLGRQVDVVSLGALRERDDDIRRDAIWL
jgi:predicted nucleotidyltransferase